MISQHLWDTSMSCCLKKMCFPSIENWGLAAFRPGGGKPCVVFLSYWKNDSFLALWYLISKAFSILFLTSQLPLCCRLLSQLNQSPGNTLKPSAWFHTGDSIHWVRLPKVLLTSMHSNLISKHHSGLLLFLFSDSHKSSGNSQTSAFRDKKNGHKGQTERRFEGGKQEKRKEKNRNWTIEEGLIIAFCFFPPWDTHTHSYWAPLGLRSHWLPTEMVFVS